MDHNNLPPAPPPYQPVTPHHNPYEFITNPPPAPKKSLLPGGNSKMQRLLIASGGLVMLLLLAIIIMSFINSGGANLKTDYLSLAQQQTELVRISEIGVTKAKQSEAKNLAITTKLTIASQQVTTLSLAKKAGADTATKSLALGKNSQTDALLTTAEQSNQFDETFTKTVLASLKTYQQTLKKIYDAADDKSTKTTYSNYYSAVGTLLGPEPVPHQL